MENFCKCCIFSFQYNQRNGNNSIRFVIYSIHKGSNIDEIIDIPDVMFNPGRMRQPHFYDEIILSLERQPAQQADAVISAGVYISGEQ